MNFDIAVVIPVFNESQEIGRTLSKFSANGGREALIIVVDNNSNDQTAQCINDWQKENDKQPLVLLKENTKGSLYARKKGLEYAKACASVAISTDADCWPLSDFYKNIQSDFLNNHTADVLIGLDRHEAQTRLLKQLYLPNLMNLIAWQEHIEIMLFGPFFFGGYFGIKTDKINNTVFSTNNIPIKLEPSVFWSRHCNYQGYTFIQSKPDMRTSSRRIWDDPYGFYTNERSKSVRTNPPNIDEQKRMLSQLQINEKIIIDLRQKRFAYRLLMFMLDAIFFEKKILDINIVSTAIEKSCNFLEIDPVDIRRLNNLSIVEAKKTLTAKEGFVLKILEHKRNNNYALQQTQ